MNGQDNSPPDSDNAAYIKPDAQNESQAAPQTGEPQTAEPQIDAGAAGAESAQAESAQASVSDNVVADILQDVTPPQDEAAPLSETQQIEALQAQLKAKEDEALRALAELQNTRRRAEKDRQDALNYGVTSFARDMIAVGDNLTRALKAISESDRDGLSENITNLLEGVAATERDLLAALARHHITPLTPMGEMFDAHRHEALYEARDTGQPSGTIIEVVEIGYMIGERLLRAAKVGVAKD